MEGFDNLLVRNSKSQKEVGPYCHTMAVSMAVIQLKTNLEFGLTQEECAARLKLHGINKLTKDFRTPIWIIVLRHTLDIYNIFLFLVMVFSFYTEDVLSGVIYLVLITTNGGIGFYQDYKSQMTIDCLNSLTSFNSNVLRGGCIVNIPSKELVPGDILILETGDVIGADARLFEQSTFSCDEAHLTGESIPVYKDFMRTFSQDTPAGDRINMVFSGTTATKGRAKAIVGHTGIKSLMGRIAEALSRSKAGNTRLVKRSLRRMGFLFILSIIPIMLFSVLVVSRGPLSVRISYIISLVTAIIPKSLEPIATISSFLGIKRMLAHKAIIRRNDILEISGSLTNICTDKTGTLALAKMIVTKIWVPYYGYFKVEGNGYSPVGGVIHKDSGSIVPTNDIPEPLELLARTASLCNNARLTKGKGDKHWVGLGDPTEAALLAFACKLNLSKDELINSKNPNHFKLIVELPFDPVLKCMSSVYIHNPSGRKFVYTKGAIESVLPICDNMMDNDHVISSSESQLVKLSTLPMECLASEGLRSLCLAYSELNPDLDVSSTTDREVVERNLTFLGLVGIYDPPRPETKQTVQVFHKAGITVHMLTGDHIATATSIAKEVGIIDKNATVTEGMVMQATEFDNFEDKDLDQLVNLPLVVARCSPATKAKMVHALHRRKRTVAMTGDGVNDAPSLRIANVGIGMGLNGAGVAKQASDVVLADDNFATIFRVIKEGRRAIANIVNMARFFLSVNVASLVLLMLGMLIKDTDGNFSLHLSSFQMLLLHLASIPLIGLGLGLEPSQKQSMARPPRPVSYGIFTMEATLDIFVYGIVIGGISFSSYWLLLLMVSDSYKIPSITQITRIEGYELVFRARAASFQCFVTLCILNALNCRSMRSLSWTINELKSAYHNHFLRWSILFGLLAPIPFIYIPGIRELFYSAPITWEWAFVPATCLLFILLSEAYKFFKLSVFGPE